MHINRSVKLAFASVLLVALAACSDDDDDDDSVVNDDTAEPIASPADPIVTPEPTDAPEATAAVAEAQSLLTALGDMGGSPFNAETAVIFPDEFNLFIPSITGVDLNEADEENPSGPTVRMPMFEGRDPAGNPVDYIITEASDQAVADLMGLVFAPRMAAGADSPGSQQVTLDNGIMVFPGAVDFSPIRSVTPGDPNATEGPNSITRSEFPPAAVQPGAVADDEWSSLVVLPSGLVLNAQLVANATGIHDRIPDSAQDDQSNPNLDRTNRFVVMQLLDGWQDDERYYFHLVTDASVPDAASIELGVFAPRVGSFANSWRIS